MKMATSLTEHRAIVTWVGISVMLYFGSVDGLGGISLLRGAVETVGDALSDVDLTVENAVANLLNIGLDGECLLCGSNPKKCRAVPMFFYCFSKGVLDSPQLLDMFDLSQVTPKELEKVLFLLVLQTLAEKMDEKPAMDSNVTTRYISSCVHSLNLPLMIRLYSVPVAKFLQNKGKLNSDNACDLAKQYVQIMKDAGDSISDMHCDQRAKAVALGLGYENFHTSLGLFTPANCFQMALTFGNDLLEIPEYYKGVSLLQPKTSSSGRGFSLLKKKKCKEPTINLDKSFCNFNPPAVQEFVDSYVDGVLNSKSLKKAYDIQNLTGEQYQTALTVIAARCYSKIFGLDPVQFSQGIAKGFSAFDSPPPPKVVAKVYAATIAKHLFAKGILNSANAEEKARDYLALSKKEFKTIIDNSNPMTKPIAQLTVGRDFMKKNGAFETEDVPQIAAFFGMQWACLANEAKQ